MWETTTDLWQIAVTDHAHEAWLLSIIYARQTLARKHLSPSALSWSRLFDFLAHSSAEPPMATPLSASPLVVAHDEGGLPIAPDIRHLYVIHPVDQRYSD